MHDAVVFAQGIGLGWQICILLMLYASKGFMWLPPFFAATICCCLLPTPLSYIVAIGGHLLIGHVISWHFGAASVGKDWKPPRLLRNVNPDKYWKVILCFFVFMPTDVILTFLKSKKVRGAWALTACIPFVVLADTIIVFSGKGVLGFLLSLYERT
jgi:hypothetical protein